MGSNAFRCRSLRHRSSYGHPLRKLSAPPGHVSESCFAFGTRHYSFKSNNHRTVRASIDSFVGFRALRVPKVASCVRRELRRVESTHSCRLLGTRHRNAPQRSMKNTRMRRSSCRVLSELVGHVGRPNCETPTGACWPRSSARAGADRIVVWGSPSLYGDPSDRATQREVAQPLT